MSAEEILHRLISKDPEPILSLAQAVMERLNAADGSGAEELLASEDTDTLRDLRQAAALLEYHARVQLYIRNDGCIAPTRSVSLENSRAFGLFSWVRYFCALLRA